MRLGVSEDPVFGPVIYLGPSLITKCPECRFAVALPPLNLTLARDLVTRSRLADDLPNDERATLASAMSQMLVRLSQLLVDIDEVSGVELDPLYVERTGAVVLKSCIRIEKRGRKHGLRRFAIPVYPKELEHQVEWDGRKLLIRPIRPEDESMLNDLITSLTPEDARMRFFDTMKKLPRSQLARFTQIDYDREMALVAVERDSNGVECSLGEVRLVADPDSAFADFAIVLRSEIKGKGLGRLLMQRIIAYSRSRGIGELRGDTLAGNLRMQHLAHTLGFTLSTGSDRGSIDLRLALREPEKK
jgi:acetyltransferase